jgi:uncharacterized membrane protein YfcA
MDFSLDAVLITATIFLFAAFFHGSIGFGFPMVATPLLALTTDLQTAVILTLVPTALVNLISIASEGNILAAVRKHLPLALFAMTGSAIGTQILIVTNSELFKALLSLAIIGYLLIDKFRVELSWVESKPALSKPLFGISAGVLGGLTNVMAPVLIIYSLEAKLEKNEIVQSANICFLLGKIIQLILFSSQGKFTANELVLSSLLILLVLIALYAGFKIKRRLNQATYKQALRGFLLLLAISLLFQVLV